MLNCVVIMGRLVADPELRTTTSGISRTSFRVAVDRRYQKSGEEKQTDFISCVAWRQPADFLGQYARKGALIGVDGRIQTRSYDRDGQKVYVTEVVADTVQLLESRSQSEARAQQSGGYQDNYGYQQPSYQQSYQQPSQQPSYDDFGSPAGLDISSDDLPF